jgi:stage II sporulation protein D
MQLYKFYKLKKYIKINKGEFMKQIYIKILIAIILLLFITCIHFPKIQYITNNETSNDKEEIMVNIKIDNKIIKKELNEYLVGVIAGEMPAEFELEALKAQAVASRTFVLSRNLEVDNTTNSQVYLTDDEMKEKWENHYKEYKEKIEKAVKETNNEVMLYNGEYISALFFSSCNGKTNNSEDYFNDEVAYLKSVDSKWDLTVDKNNIKTKSFSKQKLASIFNVDIKSLKIMSYCESGYVKTMVVNDKEYSGRKIRELLGLASSSFQVTYSKNKYTFTTSGNGHGVGMSQYGAQGMAKENKNYKEILNHYYKNIEIKSIES